MTFTNRQSKTFRYLSEASYSVYLFHHAIVVAGGLVLIEIGVGGVTGALILIGTTMLLTLFIHQFIITKLSWMKYLYNGK